MVGQQSCLHAVHWGPILPGKGASLGNIGVHERGALGGHYGGPMPTVVCSAVLSIQPELTPNTGITAKASQMSVGASVRAGL